jgi:hypothetical protein
VVIRRNSYNRASLFRLREEMLFARPLFAAAAALATGAGLIVPDASWACSACGCTLNSDWASQGLAASGGWRFDARYDFSEQDQLRTGTDSVSASSLDYPNEREVQKYTINRNYTFALDYSPNKDWGFTAVLPWSNRSHATIAEGDTEVSTSHDAGIGDLRLMARYMGLGEQRSTGIEFGVKLPTGRFDSPFDAGPRRGDTVDRGLQLGSGTSDALFGVYNFGALATDWGYFAQAQVQAALTSRDQFKPGRSLTVNFGLRYTASATFVPQLQFNARAERREQGANADVENSGATLAYLSPGLTWNVSPRFSAFAFLQVPIYQRVNGLQIEARELASVGLHYHF